ncbi:histidinol-phosphate transaminase [Glaciecola sp. 1036]|uniref:histidinol-phosphate transaminase n=1 Tax=Alteromonadaceae TaxID=72275 RepID=UPI003CFE8AAC
MADWIDNITNNYVRKLVPYQSARRLFSSDSAQGQPLWLNANEAPEAENIDIDSSLFNRYPDCQPTSVIDAYAAYAGLNKKQVLVSRGADEGIELIIRAFCAPGKSSILICPPTYGMYAISAETFNVGVERAPLNKDFTLQLDEIEKYVDKVNVVFLCSPNNPTGTLISQQQIRQVLSMFEGKAVVVLDEAYIEFSHQDNQSALLAEYENLVILRTLSKAFALAGIRCGFTLASEKIIQTLLKVIAPYPVPAPVAQVAAKALSTTGINKTLVRVKKLSSELTRIQLHLLTIEGVSIVGDTKGNFVLFRHPENPELMQYLVSQNLYIRDQSKQLLLDNCLRITVGTVDENNRLLDAINAFFTNPLARQNKE